MVEEREANPAVLHTLVGTGLAIVLVGTLARGGEHHRQAIALPVTVVVIESPLWLSMHTDSSHDLLNERGDAVQGILVEPPLGPRVHHSIHGNLAEGWQATRRGSLQTRSLDGTRHVIYQKLPLPLEVELVSGSRRVRRVTRAGCSRRGFRERPPPRWRLRQLFLFWRLLLLSLRLDGVQGLQIHVRLPGSLELSMSFALPLQERLLYSLDLHFGRDVHDVVESAIISLLRQPHVRLDGLRGRGLLGGGVPELLTSNQ